MAITKAPFETFGAYEDRAALESPYNESFLAECRNKAIEYSKEDIFLRGPLLTDLEKAIPLHFRGKVFDGISFVRCR